MKAWGAGAVPKPLLGYYGGKAGPVGAWIATQLPPHHTYVEPFGGMGGVLMQKRPSPVEVYNDRADELVNLFQVLRDPQTRARLQQALELTPYARAEYVRAKSPRVRRAVTDPVERARLTYVVLAQSRDGALAKQSGWSFGGPSYNGSAAEAFVRGQQRIPEVVDRLRNVCIECADALDVLRRYDSPASCFYVDPPYTRGERTANAAYIHELTDADHLELLRSLRSLRGFVLVSGYRSLLYAHELEDHGWLRRDFATVAHSSAARGAGKRAARVESLWLNRAAARHTPTLFCSQD